MDIDITITLTDELLGTVAGDPEVADTFIISKAATDEQRAEEADSLPDVEQAIHKATTRFHRNADGEPFLYDYQIKGFFKDACGALRRADDTLSAKLKAYKKEIDGVIFIAQRRIPLALPDGGEIGICQRPLRAQTAQGERVSLARSETVPAGTTMSFTVSLMAKRLEDLLMEWLDYGQYRGLGQWRNSGKGRFTYQAKVVEAAQVDG